VAFSRHVEDSRIATTIVASGEKEAGPREAATPYRIKTQCFRFAVSADWQPTKSPVFGPNAQLPDIRGRPGERASSTDFVDKPDLERRRPAFAAVCQRGKVRPGASCGEVRRRQWDELRQFPQIFGGGGQEELVLRSVRPPQAQAVELQDALQMSEEHLDLLPLTT
jgi:hypothetical protein